MDEEEAALVLRGLRVVHRRWRRVRHLVDGLDLAVPRGRVIGLLARPEAGAEDAVLALFGRARRTGTTVISGSVRLAGEELVGQEPARWQGRVRGRIALAGAEPSARRRTLGAQLRRALRGLPRRAREAAALDLLRRAGIAEPGAALTRRPAALEPGDRARAALALAVAGAPDLVVVQAPRIGTCLPGDLRRLLGPGGPGALVVSDRLEDLSGADGIVVLHAGRAMEEAPPAALPGAAAHPFTRALSAGTVPAEAPRLRPAPGCPHAPDCRYRMAICAEMPPQAYPVGDAHLSACFLADPGMVEIHGASAAAPPPHWATRAADRAPARAVGPAAPPLESGDGPPTGPGAQAADADPVAAATAAAAKRPNVPEGRTEPGRSAAPLQTRPPSEPDGPKVPRTATTRSATTRSAPAEPDAGPSAAAPTPSVDTAPGESGRPGPDAAVGAPPAAPSSRGTPAMAAPSARDASPPKTSRPDPSRPDSSRPVASGTATPGPDGTPPVRGEAPRPAGRADPRAAPPGPSLAWPDPKDLAERGGPG
ncbi:hypothetical protein [Wenxinia saemankumensis]|uniref:ABC-type dipeptide/oligopeptide/nickel transport system, ATPase component n=1 Tax=Wenxinia saemankumensis TaxID=1447782 RepID=A0A1M6AKI4_9RHOB|nr:hypothetical protein [Wenxinia saemankumensis]SHI36723.1 ABC-type dipeptide/oligopeptide/nickel transport system, ATPase component [Wenxinia saemankumensis]